MKKFSKTDAGHIAFKTRSGAIPARLRSVFILFDGNKTLSEVLRMGSVLGATPGDIDDLVAAGMLALVSDAKVTAQEPASTPAHAPAHAPPPPRNSYADLYAKAMPIATRITANLGLRGFRLNLAVEAAMGYEDLCTLLPKIRAAAGDEKVLELERALLVG